MMAAFRLSPIATWQKQLSRVQLLFKLSRERSSMASCACSHADYGDENALGSGSFNQKTWGNNVIYTKYCIHSSSIVFPNRTIFFF